MLSVALKQQGLEIHQAPDPREGLRLIGELRPRMVITDLVMPNMSGLDLLKQITRIDPTIDVILMTAHYTTETAVEAIRLGAADYLEKPVKLDRLRERVAALVESYQRRHSMLSGNSALVNDAQFEGIISRSALMWDLFGTIQRVSRHYRSVLLTGPSGVGKELIARAIHNQSGVRGPLVTVNCSAITDTLFESEMFGHVKGAFTGADRDKMGLFESADEGTLFLDEIGDMPLSTQAKMLRVLQNQEVLRVGSLQPRRVNVRVIAATHQDLAALIAQNRFRHDLYFRLSMLELKVPALKDRREDIPLLANYFLHRFCQQYGKNPIPVDPKALALLTQYDWPGNVRELEHVMGRAAMLAGNAVTINDLPEALIRYSPATTTPSHPNGLPHLAAQEKTAVEEAMQLANGNQSDAARRLGIGRDALRYKLKKYDLV